MLFRSQNVVGIIPDDMTKNWFVPAGSLTPEQQAALEAAQRQTGLRGSVNEGLRWGRLYGGAAGLIWIRGQEGSLDRPLDPEAILPGAFAGLYILDRWCGIAPEAGLVPESGKLVPEFYTIRFPDGRTAARVHHSRIIRFLGRELPDRKSTRLNSSH